MIVIQTIESCEQPKLKLRDMFNKGKVPSSTTLQNIFRSKYMNKEIINHAEVTTKNNCVWWLYVFKGDKTLFAIEDGKRIELDVAYDKLNSVELQRPVVVDFTLKNQAILRRL